jgi:murein DD-endopeptidase MepM/ murein hydrolase activator NlpD
MSMPASSAAIAIYRRRAALLRAASVRRMLVRALGGAAGVLCVVLASSVAASAGAQKLYKYQDANGVWVFTDRQPGSDRNYEESALARRFEKPEVRLLQRSGEAGIVLVAQNTFFAPVQIAYRLTDTDNVAAATKKSGLAMLPPRSDTDLVWVQKASAGVAMSFQSEFQFLPGDPAAEHRPTEPYRFPWAAGGAVRVSQAYPDAITHQDPSSTHAIDFVMPIGTPVYAARGGTVIEVASDFFEGGVNPAVDGPRANVVRVLHDDGTMSLYGHLNWNSIRVVPGQRVARGEYLADSGNTGFTTGPHLHFVVQRNRGGAIVSVPIEFAGDRGAPVTVRTGAIYVAR